MIAQQSIPETADPLPYIITFAVLFLISLGVLTWVLDELFKSHECVLHPNIWCSDNWTCSSSCPTGGGQNECFVNPGATGLASCIFGPSSAIANTCITAATGGLACECPAPVAGTNTCLAGCAQSLGAVPSSATCCCIPGMKGCTNTEIPAACLSIS